MITQIYKQNGTEIKIESAESLEDAQVNGFSSGDFSRYYVNTRPVGGYMDVIETMLTEIHKHKKDFTIDEPGLIKQRNAVIDLQNKAILAEIEKLKAEYKQMGVDADTLKLIDDTYKDLRISVEKLDDHGIRVR